MRRYFFGILLLAAFSQPSFGLNRKETLSALKEGDYATLGVVMDAIDFAQQGDEEARRLLFQYYGRVKNQAYSFEEFAKFSSESSRGRTQLLELIEREDMNWDEGRCEAGGALFEAWGSAQAHDLVKYITDLVARKPPEGARFPLCLMVNYDKYDLWEAAHSLVASKNPQDRLVGIEFLLESRFIPGNLLREASLEEDPEILNALARSGDRRIRDRLIARLHSETDEYKKRNIIQALELIPDLDTFQALKLEHRRDRRPNVQMDIENVVNSWESGRYGEKIRLQLNAAIFR